MAKFNFDDFARTTLTPATNADGSPITPQQMDRVIQYLKSPGSGPDSATSYAEFVEAKMKQFPPELAAGREYVGFSGKDSHKAYNFDNAEAYAVVDGREAMLQPAQQSLEQAEVVKQEQARQQGREQAPPAMHM